MTAVETALGAGAQNLVVRTAEAAKAAIRYLKSRHEGRATFLPLDTLRVPTLKPEEKALLDLPGTIGFAADLVRCDETVKPAVRILIGRVLVAETMDHALEAARKSGFRLRVVTLDGDVVNVGGSLTGGSRQKKENGYLSRERDVKEQEAALRNCNKELLAIQEEKEVLEDELDEREKRLEELRQTVQQRNIRLTDIRAEEQRIANAANTTK